MSPTIAFFAKGWSRLRFSFFAGLSILFLVRIFSVILNTQTNLGELMRPKIFYPDYIGWVSVGLFLILAVMHHLSLRDLPEKFSRKLVKVYPICFVFLALFTTKISDRSYLSRLFDGHLGFEDFLTLQSMDFFFQAPYTFWCLCWFPLTLYLLKKFHQEKFVDIMWLAPFALLSLEMNNMLMVFYLVVFCVTVLGRKFHSSHSPRAIFLFWGLSLLTTIVYLSYFSIVYRATILAVTILFPIAWIIGFWYLRTCQQENSSKSNVMSWFSIAIFGGILSQVISIDPMGKALFNFWFLLASLNFAFLSIIPTLFSLAIAMAGGLISRRVEKPIFAALVLFFATFYFADALVFFKNGLRLNFHTVDWVIGLNNISSILQTAMEVMNLKILLLILSLPALIVMVGIISQREYSEKTNGAIKGSLLLIIFISSLSHIGYSFATLPLNVLRDPVRNFISSVPYFVDLFENKPDLDTLKKDFAEIGFDIDKDVKDFAAQQLQIKDKKPKNLILITLESTGNEYISLFGQKDLTWPKLETLKDRMEIFPFYFSTFPESSNAEFSLMTGLMPVSFHILRNKPEFHSETLIEALKSAGYDCSIFFSGFLGDTGLSSFYLPRGADRIFDATTLPGTSVDDGWTWGIKEHVMVDHINSFLDVKSKNPDKPFYISYRTIFPHTPFDRIGNTPPHFSEEDYFKGKWVGRFKNSLVYMDSQIYRIIEKLKTAGLEKNTYVVIVADHATMLGEFGMVGHGWNCAPYLTNVPLLIINPESTGLKTNTTLGSHADLLPTVLNLVGVQFPHNNIIQGQDLRATQTASRSVFLSSFNHQALVEDHVYYWYIEDLNQCQVYTFDLLGNKTKFKLAKDQSPYGVNERLQKVKRLKKLQKNLLMNFEYYNDQYKKENPSN